MDDLETWIVLVKFWAVVLFIGFLFNGVEGLKFTFCLCAISAWTMGTTFLFFQLCRKTGWM